MKLDVFGCQDLPSVPVDLKPGLVVRVGNKLYARCSECKRVVRINKPFIGDLHVC